MYDKVIIFKVRGNEGQRLVLLSGELHWLLLCRYSRRWPMPAAGRIRLGISWPLKLELISDENSAIFTLGRSDGE